jgi:orotidine-5'-phosphate decarboxylase
MTAANPLIVALDSADRAQLTGWADALAGEVGTLKVGLQAFVAHGPELVRDIAGRAPVFADLKLHDIPNTVAGAAAAAADLGVAMLTVHASGGPRMIAAAAEAAPDTAILAVTVLTSLDELALQMVGQRPVHEQVPALALLAIESGAAGVVCAAGDVRAVRQAVGEDALIVVPGIRPPGSAVDDQARTATPAEALSSGATHLVVGRPITQAPDPVVAARAILASLA